MTVSYGTTGIFEAAALNCSRLSDSSATCVTVGGVGAGWFVRVSVASQDGVSGVGLGAFG